ncbi:unnamed protein product [Schistosoma margrebowiei]|uniref:Uncharacterized protein n=1 Tax=Schistosoma margrebowiei TaxID=48269 RepID=A0A183MMF4_9TREM|nr:unnamed protein product [Schistosoma margrebowiei]
MAIPSDQLQLLFQRQQQHFKKHLLEFIEELHTCLLNYPCFGDVTGVNELISKLRTELENDCIMNVCVSEGSHKSLTSSDLNETAAIIHDPPSDPRMFISETCHAVSSNPIIPETQFTSSDLSSSQKDGVSLNSYEETK